MHGVIRKVLAVELYTRLDDPDGLGGSGVIIVNPPWRTDHVLRSALPALAARLADDEHDPDASARSRVEWLVGE